MHLPLSLDYDTLTRNALHAEVQVMHGVAVLA